MSRDGRDGDGSDDVRSRGSTTSSDGDDGFDADDGSDANDGFDADDGSDGSTETTDQTADATSGPDDQTGARDVVVPMEIYKVVTVFSTLIAVPAVVIGFMFLDAATLQVSFMRRVVTLLFTAVGIVPDPAVLSALLAIVGLLLIALGGGVYVLGARFRAEGMGNAEEDTDEQSTNG